MNTVYWLTGLPGAGKTTLAYALQKEFWSRSIQTVVLDGDSLRNILDVGDQYSKDSRRTLSARYQALAKLINDQGLSVIVSTVSMFEEIRKSNREIFNSYFEVFLDVDIAVLRDVPGREKIYAEQGPTNPLSDVEYPKNPDLILRYDPGCQREFWKVQFWSEVEKRGLA